MSNQYPVKTQPSYTGEGGATTSQPMAVEQTISTESLPLVPQRSSAARQPMYDHPENKQ